MAEYTGSLVEEIVSYYRMWLDHWSGLRTRTMQIRALAAGSWAQVFSGEDDIDYPMVENLFRDTIEDGGRLFAEMLPSERVFPKGNRDETRAEQIEQVLNGFTQGSGIFNLPEFFGMDMIATGLTALKVWPSTRGGEDERYPRFRRIEPDFVLPDPTWAPDQPTERVLLHYRESTARLQREYPEPMKRLLDRMASISSQKAKALRYDIQQMLEVVEPPAEMTVIELYSTTWIARCLYYDGEYGLEAELIDYRKNDTGICPVQIAARSTWAREPLGQLDDSKGTVRTQNRYMRLLTDYFVEMVYGGKLSWNVKNPTERGPGTVYFGLGPDAKLEPVTPNQPGFQAWEVIDRLESAARSGMNNPRSREGDVQLNKATAAFLTRAQGKLSSSVRGLQRSFAVAKRYANEAALAQDEAWCNHRKTIIGLARGKRYQLTYTPTDLIRGDHANVVSYGTSSGLDGPTHQVLWLEKRQARTVSLETYLENDPAVDDVPGEMSRLSSDEMRESILLGLKLPDTPLADRLRAYKAFLDGQDLAGVVDALLAAQQPAAPAIPGLPPQAGGGRPAVGAPPGIPGAEGGTGPVLPPIELLRQVRGAPTPAPTRR